MFDCDEEYLLKKADEQIERWVKVITAGTIPDGFV